MYELNNVLESTKKTFDLYSKDNDMRDAPCSSTQHGSTTITSPHQMLLDHVINKIKS